MIVSKSAYLLCTKLFFIGIPVHHPVQVQRTDGEGVQDLQGQFSQEVRACQTSTVSACITVYLLHYVQFVYRGQYENWT